MDEITVEVGDEEVRVKETEDGFEVKPIADEPGTVEHFAQNVVEEGDSLCVGSVDELELWYSDFIRMHVDKDDYDVVRSALTDAREEGYIVERVEFEHGYIDFVYTGE